MVSLVQEIKPGTNSHWLLGGEAVDAGEDGDASLKSTSPPWVGGPFQACFHWYLEDSVDDVLSFFFGASSFGVAWEVEMKW